MTRSFTDRLLGGVCGGIAASFRLHGWLIRALFIVGGVLTTGALAALYIALWWALPQQSLVKRRGGIGSTFMMLLLTVLILGIWGAQQANLLIVPTTGQSLYLPALALVLGAVYLLRQLRAS